MTVEQCIQAIIHKTGVEPLPEDKTCDHLMTGDPQAQVHKIGTTFMATVDVIREAASQGVDFIITHEPTWFTGADQTDWVELDPVYIEKKKLIEEHGIAIWRFHDHMHMDQEDGIYRGFDREFGWEKYRDHSVHGFGAVYDLPETSLKELSCFFKEKMQMKVIQIVGDSQMKVKRVSVLVGGGSLGLGMENMPMIHMKEQDIDVAICGDITEWTLPAYVRDASQLGMNKGLLILGHERSEEPGMKYLPEWLQSITNEIPIVFLDSKEPFDYF